jgi:hypothetical protein
LQSKQKLEKLLAQRAEADELAQRNILRDAKVAPALQVSLRVQLYCPVPTPGQAQQDSLKRAQLEVRTRARF